MVGGKVIGVARGQENTLLNVQGTGSESRDVCAVRCIEIRLDNGDLVCICNGDLVWWQAGYVFWTPIDSPHFKQGFDWDIKLEKIGYSH